MIKDLLNKFKANKKFDAIKTLLKGATYAGLTTAGSLVIQSIQGGMDFQKALLMGIGVGVVAGVKNLFKHAWNIDLDLTRLKK